MKLLNNTRSQLRHMALALALALAGVSFTQAQPPGGGGFGGGGPGIGGGPGGGGPGRGGPGFGGGPGGGGRGGGGMGAQETKLIPQFDKDGDGRLNDAERKAARDSMAAGRGGGRGRGGPGGRGGGEPTEPGRKLVPADVKSFPATTPLYDPLTLRTIFIEFPNADWEAEMGAFHKTDVDVPAKVTVDGKVYPDVGVHFHGNSSFVGAGQKRSLVLSFDFVNEKQNLYGYRNITLLNAHEDASFLRTVLSLQVARDYIPAPKANFMRVVINGESWGLYPNQQHFDKDFTKENFSSTKGARWKVPGSPGTRAGLEYLGEDVAAYKRLYNIKTKDDPKSWADFINLCKVLNETPADQLERKLASLLDIDAALKYLAWDIALVNGDGYWTRTSDYEIYEDEKGRFHIIPYDANETFSSGGGPGGGRGGRGGPGGGGPGGPGGGPGGGGPGAGRGGGGNIDPLVNVNDSTKPLHSKLLAVPALRTRYLGYVRDIAEKWLDWSKVGPIAQQYHDLIVEDVKLDTRKLESADAFERSFTDGTGTASLKGWSETRRTYLLSLPK